MNSIHSYRKKQKDKLREIRRKRKEQQQTEAGDSAEGKALLQDDRFKSVDSARFEKKFRKRPAKDAKDTKEIKPKLSKTNATNAKRMGKAAAKQKLSKTNAAMNAKRKAKVMK